MVNIDRFLKTVPVRVPCEFPKIQSKGLFPNLTDARLSVVEAEFGPISLQNYLSVYRKYALKDSNGNGHNGATK